MSLNDLLNEALASIRDGGAETVPAGFMTVTDMARQCGGARPSMQRQLANLMHAGRLEVREFRVRAGQVLRPIPHYRLIPQHEHHTAD